MNYQDWLKYRSNLAKRDVSTDERDYDMKSYFNSLKSTPNDPEAAGHLPDTFKKPNHPTFSNESIYHIPGIQEGGKWGREGEADTFTPSEHNVRNLSSEGLDDYFNEVEPEAKLKLFSNLRSKLR